MQLDVFHWHRKDPNAMNLSNILFYILYLMDFFSLQENLEGVGTLEWGNFFIDKELWQKSIN